MKFSNENKGITVVYVNVGEVCREENFSVRLTQIPSIRGANAGRLEVCLNREWGAVVGPTSPADFWPLKNVLVVCKQLGFDVGLNSIPPAGYVCMLCKMWCVRMQNMYVCMYVRRMCVCVLCMCVPTSICVICGSHR